MSGSAAKNDPEPSYNAAQAPRGLASAPPLAGAGQVPPAAAPATPLAAEQVAAAAAAAAGQPGPLPPRKQRNPPQDIGIPALLLGQGADVAEAADAIDHLPLRAAGFTQQTLQAACDFLAEADPKLAPLIELHGPPDRLLAKKGSNFATLAKAIVFQQLATTTAAAIYGRVLTVCSCPDALTPAAVLAAPPAELRQAGLSERKVSYIVDLANHFSDGRLSDERIAEMDEPTLESALVAVRGIGLWTTHMHAMFHLGSPDVLPTGDLGVRRGMAQLFGLKELPGAAEMAALAEAWRPFRSVGCYYMWKVEVPRSNGGGGKKAKKARKA